MDEQTKAPGGRVVRILQRRGKAAYVDQWFIVGIDDDVEAVKAVSKVELAGAEIEIRGVLTPDVAAKWNLRRGEIKPSIPGEPT